MPKQVTEKAIKDEYQEEFEEVEPEEDLKEPDVEDLELEDEDE